MSHTDESAKRPDFEGLVEQYYRSLYQFAFSLAQSESEACDLTQQTFYIWATKGHQLRDVSKVKSWLFTTRVNQLDSAQLLVALQQIDAVYHAPVALFYLEDYAYKEIAEILSIPMGTVKSRISRGIAQLQQALGGSPPAPAAKKESRE